MISAPSGRSGKTLVSLGAIRALRNRGLIVQPFKKGPDYIDLEWQTSAACRQSRNLDCFFMDPPTMNATIAHASRGADVSLIEAAMGLYDGFDVKGSRSSAQVAKQTATPVVLVLDVTRMTRTAAAIVMGCIAFDREIEICGVIANRIKGARHERLVREAIESTCGIEVIGAVPEDPALTIADRHLGLVTCGEVSEKERLIEAVAHVIEESVDLDRLLSIAQAAGGLPLKDGTPTRVLETDRDGKVEALTKAPSVDGPVKVAVIKDSAFHFYYQENLEALENAGAELVFADSLADESLPADVDALYIGGGFPEAYAKDLEANRSFRESVRGFCEAGGVVFAECGGLMYLTKSLTVDGVSSEMVGFFACDTYMEADRQGHGYTEALVTESHPWMKTGAILKGHEHHHSRLVGLTGDEVYGLCNKRGNGIGEHRDGLCKSRTVAEYFHVNAIASPEWAPSLVSAARAHRALRKERV